MDEKDLPAILYLDDEIINLNLFQLTFKGALKIFTTSDCKVALSMVEERTEIKAVISDMKMPMMNGLEFIRSAREIRSDIPYYILSGFQSNDDIQEALDNNIIKEFFQKPFIKNQIFNTITAHIS